MKRTYPEVPAGYGVEYRHVSRFRKPVFSEFQRLVVLIGCLYTAIVIWLFS